MWETSKKLEREEDYEDQMMEEQEGKTEKQDQKAENNLEEKTGIFSL